MTLPDSVWEGIAQAGRLPPDARDDVERVIFEYREDDGAEYRRVTPETRAALGQAVEHLELLITQLETLNASPDYRMYRARATDDTSLTKHLGGLNKLRSTLEGERKRLAHRSQKGWPDMKLRWLVIQLLEIRTLFLRVNVPLQAKETTTSGQFRKYVARCIEAAAQNTDEKEREKMLEYGIKRAVMSFAKRRKDHWEFEELFPQATLSGPSKKSTRSTKNAASPKR